MNKTTLIVLLLIAIGTGCTRSRWMVQDQNAVDPDDVEVLNREFFLRQIDSPDVDEPVLKLELLSRSRFNYAQKVKVERYIQDYRPRWPFMAIGALAGGFTVYTANTDRLVDNLSRGESRLLSGAGLLISTAGFLHMKPVGEKQKTGESRFLRQTGNKQVIDTTRVTQNIPQDTLRYSIYYQNRRLAYRQPIRFNNGVVEIPIDRYLEDERIADPSPGSMLIAIGYRDQIYDYQIEMDSVMRQFAEVTIPSTSLYQKPDREQSEIVANVGEKSLLPLVDITENGWYKVMYGIRETYVARNNSRIVWKLPESDRPEDTRNQIVRVEEIPYGEIDVESNLPILAENDPNSGAFVLNNEFYRRDFSSRKYATRDARLVQDYLVNTLGVGGENVIRYDDFESREQWEALSDRLTQLPDTLDRFFGYISGNGIIEQDSSKNAVPKYHLALTNWSKDSPYSQVVNLDSLLNRLIKVPAARQIYFLDLDFSNYLNLADDKMDARRLRDQWQQHVNRLLARTGKRITIIQASRVGTPSRLYVNEGGVDRRHHLFPYYIAKGLQEEITGTKALYQYLERNVTYTSRRLFDLPQDPLIFGDRTQNLLPSR